MARSVYSLANCEICKLLIECILFITANVFLFHFSSLNIGSWKNAEADGPFQVHRWVQPSSKPFQIRVLCEWQESMWSTCDIKDKQVSKKSLKKISAQKQHTNVGVPGGAFAVALYFLSTDTTCCLSDLNWHSCC